MKSDKSLALNVVKAIRAMEKAQSLKKAAVQEMADQFGGLMHVLPHVAHGQGSAGFTGADGLEYLADENGVRCNSNGQWTTIEPEGFFTALIALYEVAKENDLAIASALAGLTGIAEHIPE